MSGMELQPRVPPPDLQVIPLARIEPYTAFPDVAPPPEPLAAPRVCIVCGDEVTKHLFPSRQRKPWLWCSRRCYKWKPQKVVSIEMRFGLHQRADIRWIIIKTAKDFQNLHDHAKALDVSVPYLYTMVRRYFRVETGRRDAKGIPITRGLSMDEFVERYARGARRRRYEDAAMLSRGSAHHLPARERARTVA